MDWQGVRYKKNKRYVFDLKVTPYFKKKKMCEIITASTEEEREKARQEYLDRVGMHPDFRW